MNEEITAKIDAKNSKLVDEIAGIATPNYLPHQVMVGCEQCGAMWSLLSCKINDKEARKKAGWKRKWSWHKFRFIWICPLCNPNPFP
jgi:Fe2+ or Zn2+ uptake regulation protein